MEAFMGQRIVGFYQDGHRDWGARCDEYGAPSLCVPARSATRGIRIHPLLPKATGTRFADAGELVSRPGLLTEEGRRQHPGQSLNCKQCEE